MSDNTKGAGLAEAAKKREEQERELFAKFLSTSQALIADPNGSSRVRLGATLAELGAKQNGIAFAGTYEEASSFIEERKPRIILCEFQLGGRSGLDLLQEQRAQHKADNKDSIFALITGNTSQSAVASAAEEDVDTFIIKPYTLETLKRTLTKAAIAKLFPSMYVQLIEAGKVLLFAGKIDESIVKFNEAAKLDPKPALALFYKGQAEALKTALDAASKDYKAGLTFNKIHYKCLVGLYELMMQKKDFKEAYNVVKKVAQYFPANPKRLAQVLRLAIMTESYEDVEAYYRIFTMVEGRTDELVRYICSALIVTGKYYLMNKYSSRGLELLDKAAVSAAGKSSYLRYVIEVLSEFDKVEEAKGVLRRFPADAQKGPDYLSMDLLISAKGAEPGVTIQKGRDLIKAGVETAIVYEIMIEALQKAGLKDSMNELLQRAVKKWPEQSKKFERFNAAAPA
jgi:CheY-like chemotaxis protein